MLPHTFPALGAAFFGDSLALYTHLDPTLDWRAQVQAPQSSASSLGMGPAVDPPPRQPYASASGELPPASVLQPVGALSATPPTSAWGVKPKQGPAPMPMPAPAPAPAPGPATLMPASLAAPGTPTHHSAGVGAHHHGGAAPVSGGAVAPASAAAMSAAMAMAMPAAGAASPGMMSSGISSAAAQIGGGYPAEDKAERVILPPQVCSRSKAPCR